MNYLAHAYLSGNSEELLVGNFIADGLRGNKMNHLPAGVQSGIHLHRQIDTFTDSHELNTEMRRLFHPTAGKFAGVVLDVFYDHLLGHNWAEFSEETLEDFVEHCYRVIEENQQLLPERTAAMFPYMRQFNWLVNYRFEEGVMRSLGGLSRRIASHPDLEAAGRVAFDNRELIQQNFLVFFPQLITFCNGISGQKINFTT